MIKKKKASGVIGIGSNSTRMLVSFPKQPLKVIDRGYALTRLFEGLDSKRNLSRKSIDATAMAIIQMYEEANNNYDLDKFWIFATSALRDAKNKEDIIDKVFKQTGKEILIISGRDEARYSFLGVGKGMRSPYGVIDIGGGSTEVAVGQKEGEIKAISYQIGALRLLKELPNINGQNIHLLLAHIQKIIDTEKKNFFPKVNTYIGVGGTFTTLKALYNNTNSDIKSQKKRFSRKQVFSMMKILFQLAPEQRESYPNMPKGRGDITPYGIGILFQIMETLEIPHIEVGQGGNLDGWLMAHLKR